MVEQGTQIRQAPLAPLEVSPLTGLTGQEKIAQILSEGVLLTMEDDLRRLREEKELGISPELKKRLEEFRKKEEVPEKPAPLEARPLTGPAVPERERPAPLEVPPLRGPAPLVARPPERRVAFPPVFLLKKEEREQVRAKLQKEKREILALLKTFPDKKRPLEEKKKQIEEVLQRKERALAEVLKREKESEEQQKVIESQEAKAETIEKRHFLERKRWAVEEKRRELEREKWLQEEGVEKLRGKIREISLSLDKVLKTEADLERKREKIVKGLKAINWQEERERLILKLREIRKRKEVLEIKRARQLQQKKDLEAQVEMARKQEKAIELEQRRLEEQERKVSLPEQREAEQKRWPIETKRKEVEKKRWFLEKNLRAQERGFSITAHAYQDVLSEEKKAAVRVEELNRLLGYRREAPLEARPLTGPEKEKVAPAQILPEAKLEQVKEEKKAIEEIRWRAKAREQEKRVEVLKAGAEERLAEEIRQRAEEEKRERLTKLKEIEEKAREARERKEAAKAKGPVSKEEILKKLTQVSPKEEAERKAFLARVAGEERPLFKLREKDWGKEVVFRPRIKKPGLWQKIMIRVLVSLLIVGLLVAGYLLLRTYVFPPKPPIQLPLVPEVEEEIVEEEEVVEEEIIEEEIIEEELPLPLIKVANTQLLQFSPVIQISSLLNQALEETEGKQGFEQILFQALQTKHILTFEEFLDVFNVIPPSGFLEDIELPVDLFIYFGETMSRFGFITKVKPENNLLAALSGWESIAEESTKDLMLTLGKKEPALVPYFRSAWHRGIGFRYQTFSKEDLGICYLITDQYFVFTTSFEAMQKVIDILMVPAPLEAVPLTGPEE